MKIPKSNFICTRFQGYMLILEIDLTGNYMISKGINKISPSQL